MADSDFTPEELESEEWRTARDFGDMIYQVSNLGRIRSVRVKILRPGLSNGYRRITFWNKHLKARSTESVHVLVAEAFHGERPEGSTDVNHKDGKKNNNRDSNLEFCTPSENARHAVSLGLWYRGAKNGAAKLSEQDIQQIFHLLTEGKPVRSIATLFGVVPRTIRLIEQGKTWSHFVAPNLGNNILDTVTVL